MKSINEQIFDVEEGLQNKYYKKLTSVWNNDSERVNARMAYEQSKLGKLKMSRLLHGSSDLTMANSGIGASKGQINFGNNVTSIRQLQGSNIGRSSSLQ